MFQCLDMEGSTGLAERLGPLAFHRLLKSFPSSISPSRLYRRAAKSIATLAMS